LNYIEIHYQNNEVHYKYTQMLWKKIQILWCFLTYIYLPLKIHFYVLIYIHIPSKYITIPSKNLTNFWYIIQYHYYTPISFHILPYTLKLSWNLSILHLFVLLLTLFFKTVLAPHYSTKMYCTCHDMFIGIQKLNKLSIFRISVARWDSWDPQISAARRDKLVYFWTFFCP
jgi:hypothetical protein